jgi:UDP-glucose 4-epimerase
MHSRRILITGLSSSLGGRLAQALEREPEVEAIIGVDASDPRHELNRTEFVRVDVQQGLIGRIVHAAAIDTVVDTRLIVDPLAASPASAHANNAFGTANILAACGGADSPVRKLVFKSSADYYGCEATDPAFFTEDMARAGQARTAIEQEILDAEALVAEFAARNAHSGVTVLRAASAIGIDERTSFLALLSLPIVPTTLGFDARCQFVDGEDIVAALAHAVRYDIPGVFNVAGDGVLALSEVVSLLGKPMLPILPPWGTTFAASQLRRTGLRIPVELLRQLRFGRGLDNRRLKSTGFSYRYTTREALVRLRAHQRLRPLLRSGAQPYQYEREVEDFLRWSPSVRTAPDGTHGGWRPSPAELAQLRRTLHALQRDQAGGTSRSAAPSGGPPVDSYDDLAGEEVIEIVSSLEIDALEALAEYETGHRARPAVLAAIDRTLARKRPSGATP